MFLTNPINSLAIAISCLYILFPKSVLANDTKHRSIARCGCNIDYANCKGCDPEGIPTITGYAGLSIGVLAETNEGDAFPFRLGNGVYGGVRFGKYLATDVELGLLGVETALSGENYSFEGVFFNPRFVLPLGIGINSLSFFVSPGIRLISLSGDEVRNTWQIKAGTSFSVTRRFHVFGQLRYVEQEDANLRGIELGSSFNF